MGYNFKANAGKSGEKANYIGDVRYLGPNRYGIIYEKDQATCKPYSVMEKGSNFAVSDPRVNANAKHDWAVVSEQQFKDICEKGTYCQKPGVARAGTMKPGDRVGILCVRGTLIKGSSGEWRVNEATAELPTGYPNVPGISTVTGQKTEQPRFKAFAKRLEDNHKVARAMRAYEDKQSTSQISVAYEEPEQRLKVDTSLDAGIDFDKELEM